MAMVAPSFLSFLSFFLSFFPFVSPERPSIHSCCKQSLELAPQHHDDASRLASPRLTMQSPGCNRHYHPEPKEKNQFTLSFFVFFFDDANSKPSDCFPERIMEPLTSSTPEARTSKL
jgi:hypothetical protein